MLREQTYLIRPGVFVHLHVAACECDSGTPGYGFVSSRSYGMLNVSHPNRCWLSNLFHAERIVRN